VGGVAPRPSPCYCLRMSYFNSLPINDFTSYTVGLAFDDDEPLVIEGVDRIYETRTYLVVKRGNTRWLYNHSSIRELIIEEK